MNIAQTTLALQETDLRHHVHPFTDAKDMAARGMRVMVRGEGVYLWDSDGKQYIDGMAGLWCANIGYGRKELAEAAYKQMSELAFYNTFFHSTTVPATLLAQKLVEITPKSVNHVFFTNSGSEANDTIIKLVRYYWNLMERPTKKTMISRHLAYHGSTLATASLSGLPSMHPGFDLPLPGFVHIEAPYWYRNGGDLDPDAYGLKAAAALEEKILELGADNVAAFVGDPVLGGAGAIPPPSTYWPEIQRICRKYDVLLVIDEVICGFGRTGKWFGSYTYGLEPDLMSVAKGLSSGYLPIAAVLMRDSIAKKIMAKDGDLAHGYTYSGHTTACAVALENIRIMEEEKIVERAGDVIAPYFQGKLRELADHPLVGEVRGIGLIGGVEIAQDKATHKPFPREANFALKCREYAYQNGLIMRPCFDTLVLAPPLVITEAEIDLTVERLRKSIDQAAQDIR